MCRDLNGHYQEHKIQQPRLSDTFSSKGKDQKVVEKNCKFCACRIF